MALILLACIYISFICFYWGRITMHLLKGQYITKEQSIKYWFFVCLSGMLSIGFLVGLCSVFWSIGPSVHFLILIPVVVYPLFVKRIDKVFIGLIWPRRSISALESVLVISLLILVLLISSAKIIHPDTVMYHAPLIKWMESYKAIPGIANYDARLGYQSSWFGLVALFRFDFLFSNNWILMNSCVLCWFLLFVCEQIFSTHQKRYRWAWMILLFICLGCWQLVRLTAASASPDFIVALLIWASFYAFLNKSNDSFYSNPVIVLFSCAAVATKLSAALILLLPVLIGLQLLWQRKLRQFWGCLLIGLLLILPSITRSIINAGYPFYPSTGFNFFSVKWKTDPAKVKQEEHYISAYARFPVRDYAQAEEVVQMTVMKWIPFWWKNLSATDKFLLLLLALLLVGNSILIKSWFSYKHNAVPIIALISLAGSIFWFVEFPDPRFGYGFLVALLLCLVANLLLVLSPFSSKTYHFFKPAVIIIIVAVFLYNSYRIIYFMGWRQLLLPEGVEYFHNDGFSPVPRYPLSPNVHLRTADIEDGFKSNNR